MVRLEKITAENLDAVLALKVNDGQNEFVSTTAESLAAAYVYGRTAYPFAVYDDDEIVGFVMMGYYKVKEYYTLWKLLIDGRYQHRGYGRQAMMLGIEYMRERFGITEVYTGVHPKNDTAKHLYESAGFEYTGLVEFGMEEMCMKL